MTTRPRKLGLLLIPVGVATALAVAPIATAVPEAGSESASATVKDLRSQGFNVMINWVGGSPDVGLSECSVTSIDTSAPPTAWVAVQCPEEGD